VVDFLKY